MRNIEIGGDWQEAGKTPLERAEHRARKTFTTYKVQMEDFRGISAYADTLPRDIKKVEERRRLYAEKMSRDPRNAEAHKLSMIFEGLTLDMINNKQTRWFGESIEAQKTSEFDDYENAVDLILTVKDQQRPDRYLTLAIDVTYSVLERDHKFIEIQEEVSSGRLSRVKYFRASDGTYGLNNVPRAVVAIDRKTLDELTLLWSNGNLADLEVHQARFMVLDELFVQMKAFAELARAKKHSEAADQFEHLARVIEGVLSKFPRRPKREELASDTGYASIIALAEKTHREARLV
ncbi:MAG: hypothetical protein HY470_01685 [Candidatus Ryanbacteria bacterium]|nr:hypothetical protein [Candidatus Ryanbacteria bacterium]